jgi:hypothetical protein
MIVARDARMGRSQFVRKQDRFAQIDTNATDWVTTSRLFTSADRGIEAGNSGQIAGKMRWKNHALENQRAASLFLVLRTCDDHPCHFALTTSLLTIGRCSALV